MDKMVDYLKEYKGKRVLITGHTGFKGSWLTNVLLYLGGEVCGVALKPNVAPNLFDMLELEGKIENHYLDIRNYEELKEVFDSFKPEIVFHLAAQPIVLESYKNPKYTYDVNVMGTVNVCECVRLSDSVKSFVNITTDKVYENIEDEGHYYKEEEKLNGYDPYSNSKSCSELVTQAYIRSFYSEKEIAVSTCRAGNVIGGGDYAENRIIPDCVRASVKGVPIVIRNPNSIRPYQHVLEADVFYLLLGIRQFMDRDLAGHYNIGPNTEDCITTGQLVKIFTEYWPGSNYIVKNSKGPHEANYLKLDSSKARKTLNWAPKWNVKTAVKKVVEFSKAPEKEIQKIMKEQIEDYINGRN